MIEDDYLLIIEADEFVKNFKTMQEFEDWLTDEDVTLIDLQECLKVFENYELYEHCAVINKAIKTKLNERL